MMAVMCRATTSGAETALTVWVAQYARSVHSRLMACVCGGHTASRPAKNECAHSSTCSAASWQKPSVSAPN